MSGVWGALLGTLVLADRYVCTYSYHPDHLMDGERLLTNRCYLLVHATSYILSPSSVSSSVLYTLLPHHYDPSPTLNRIHIRYCKQLFSSLRSRYTHLVCSRTKGPQTTGLNTLKYHKRLRVEQDRKTKKDQTGTNYFLPALKEGVKLKPEEGGFEDPGGCPNVNLGGPVDASPVPDWKVPAPEAGPALDDPGCVPEGTEFEGAPNWKLATLGAPVVGVGPEGVPKLKDCVLGGCPLAVVGVVDEAPKLKVGVELVGLVPEKPWVADAPNKEGLASAGLASSF